jgi:hypothetical protein
MSEYDIGLRRRELPSFIFAFLIAKNDREAGELKGNPRFCSPSSNRSKSLDLKLLTSLRYSAQSRPKVGLSSKAFPLILLFSPFYFSVSIKARPNETAISIR